MRILVGDRFGKVLEEMTPGVAALSWVLDGVGRTTLTFAKSDSKTTELNLRVGNRVYVENDAGLPVWGGTIELPTRWDSGVVAVTCYEIGYMLQFRPTRKNDAFYNRPVGSIFYDLLTREEAKDPTCITMGTVWAGGRNHSPRYHYKSLWDVLTNSLAKMERCDFIFTPYLDGNNIRFRAELFEVAGSDKTSSVALVESANVGKDLKLEEQGDVVNVHYAAGAGSTWGDERLVVVARNPSSVAKYGLRATGMVYSGVSEQSTLEMHATNVINEQAEPRKIFTLPVTNNEPGLFAAYNLGDTVRAILPSYGFGGFDGGLRILAREYNPNDGSCKLVVEAVSTPDVWIYDGAGEEQE